MPRGLVGMHQAGAGGCVVGVPGEHGLTEPGPEHDAAVSRRHVAAAVAVNPVRRAAEFRVLNHAEQVHGDRAQPGRLGHAHRLHSCPWCSQLARLASGSLTTWKAPAGPLSSELGPGPWPNSMHWPVEITPIVR